MPRTEWTGNFFIGNSLLSNTCGLQGTSASNTFKDNVLASNGADFCP